MAHLSDIELYYSHPENINAGKIKISGEEFHHAVNVMRHSVNDKLFVTDGEGNFYTSSIVSITSKELESRIIDEKHFSNQNHNVYFCIPYLKNPERMKFAIEKSVELGITSFILFSSGRTIARAVNLKRLSKIGLSAMKQSLRTYIPEISESNFNEIVKDNAIKIIFDQKGETDFRFENDARKKYYFLFGPEGGFDSDELKLINGDKIISLGNHRLRTETAIVKCASVLEGL